VRLSLASGIRARAPRLSELLVVDAGSRAEDTRDSSARPRSLTTL